MEFEDVAIYYLLEPTEEKETGPWTLRQVREKWYAGQVQASTLFAVEGMNEWKPLEQIRDKINGSRRVTTPVQVIEEEAPPPPPRSLKQTVLALGYAVMVGLIAIFVLLWRMPVDPGPNAPETFSYKPVEGDWEVLRIQDEAPEVKLGLLARFKGNAGQVQAYRAATNTLAGILVSPASARFAPFEECTVTGEQRPWVRGWVDSQNGFGALLRLEFDVRMERHGETLYVETVRTKDRTGSAKLARELEEAAREIDASARRYGAW